MVLLLLTPFERGVELPDLLILLDLGVVVLLLIFEFRIGEFTLELVELLLILEFRIGELTLEFVLLLLFVVLRLIVLSVVLDLLEDVAFLLLKL